MHSFDILLKKFDSILKEKNLPHYNFLSEPLSAQEMTFFLNQLNVANEDLMIFYSWKNGFDPDENKNIICQIFNFGAPLSLQAIQGKQSVNKNSFIWQHSFIPIITDGTGQYLLFNNALGVDYGKIYLYSASLLFTEPVSYFDSLKDMIETTLQAYENDVFYYNEAEDWLDKDIDRFHDIAKSMNRSSEYWRL